MKDATTRARELAEGIRDRIDGKLSMTHEAFGLYEAAFERFIATALEAERASALEEAETVVMEFKRDWTQGWREQLVASLRTLITPPAPNGGSDE